MRTIIVNGNIIPGDGEKILKESSELLKSSPGELADRIQKLIDENKKIRQELRQAKMEGTGPDLEKILAEAEEVDGVKVLAAEQDTSVTAIMEKLLSDYAAHYEGYRQARQDHLELIKSGLDLGTEGVSNWTREELHER